MAKWLSAERHVAPGVRLLRSDRSRPIDQYINYFGDGPARPGTPMAPRPLSRTVPFDLILSRGARPDDAA